MLDRISLHIVVIIFCSSITTSIYCQVLTPDNGAQVSVIQEKQGKITSKILRLLEKGAYDSVLVFVDNNYMKYSKNIKQLLSTASKEIKKYKSTTEVSEGLIAYDATHNIYRFFYYATTGEKFLIDIYYMQGKPNSKVVKFAIKKKPELDKEREENIIWNDKHKNQPPSPPRNRK